MKKRILLSVPAALAALGLATVPALAQQHATFTLAESGGNVVGTWSGAFDLTGLSVTNSGVYSGYVYNSTGVGIGFNTAVGPSTSTWDQYDVPMSFNAGLSTGAQGAVFTGTFAFADSGNGDYSGFIVDFGTGAGALLLDGAGYTTGAPRSGSSTWNSTTLAALGLGVGTYVWNYGVNNSSITVQINPGGAVPEPGEWAAMGILGAGLAGLVLRKRKQA